MFLLDAGLDIFRVMLVNATFSAGQIVFEVPTGVIADTIGRRASFLIGIGSLMVATLGYVGSSVFHWGLAGFILSSILLGFGFTCQTGAVDAWMVDALDATGYSGSKDRVFARSGIFTGVSMLVGHARRRVSRATEPDHPLSTYEPGSWSAPSQSPLVFMRDIGFQPRRSDCPASARRAGRYSRPASRTAGGIR